MKKVNFLVKLKNEGKLELVEPSEEISISYVKKAEDCIKSAKILFNNKLFENSTSEAYYCMYNSLLALLFKTGIKSENHSASITLLKEVFNQDNKDIFEAKIERIDKQYYVEAHQITKVSEESCNQMVLNSENFLIRMKLFISKLNNEELKKARDKFNLLTEK